MIPVTNVFQEAILDFTVIFATNLSITNVWALANHQQPFLLTITGHAMIVYLKYFHTSTAHLMMKLHPVAVLVIRSKSGVTAARAGLIQREM